MTRDDYLIAHLREALASAPDVGALDITVEVSGDTIYLSGSVDCEDKRQAATDVVRSASPDHHVANHLKTLRLMPVEPAEVLHDSFGRNR